MRSNKHFTIAVAVGSAIAITTLSGAQSLSRANTAEPSAPIAIKDARLKFEINATDLDGGVQLFIDADEWKTMSLYDPAGHRIFTSGVEGRLGDFGGTELFMESGEPPFDELPLAELLQRWPEGTYTLKGVGLEGERYRGTAVLTHNLPAGPRLVSPLEDQGLQDPDDTVIRWRRVAPPGGSPIIGYQVLVVEPDTGITALPKITLDVMMPPDATRMRVPRGFLEPDTEYEWEVLAIESGGNQTLSSSTFTTSG